mmetsp:Transcript_10003/g.22373  ORF Transcript_10003/g.22373 Transcript_10003/m.22373 type:complete len:241 (-) Transcript_10003:144-866(-)
MAVCAGARRGSRFLAAVVAAAVALSALQVSFVSLPAAARTQPSHTGASAASAAAVAAATLGAATPAFAEEEGFLNFGKIELGGGFAINLDIPETGVINIVVLIGGLLYLLAPLLSESMASREKEIQTDIDDAISKFDEANQRLAEAQKAQSQAEAVIAEINASIEKDKKDFAVALEAAAKKTLERAEATSQLLLKEQEQSAGAKVEAYITSEAVSRGLKELTAMNAADQSKFMKQAIEAI